MICYAMLDMRSIECRSGGGEGVVVEDYGYGDGDAHEKVAWRGRRSGRWTMRGRCTRDKPAGQFVRSFVPTLNPNPPSSYFAVFSQPPQTRHRPSGGGGGPIRVR